jgi:hypothetical protein
MSLADIRQMSFKRLGNRVFVRRSRGGIGCLGELCELSGDLEQPRDDLQAKTTQDSGGDSGSGVTTVRLARQVRLPKYSTR